MVVGHLIVSALSHLLHKLAASGETCLAQNKVSVSLDVWINHRAFESADWRGYLFCFLFCSGVLGLVGRTGIRLRDALS